MKKWVYALLTLSILAFGIAIWHRPGGRPEESASAIEARRLLKTGTVTSKTYHLKYQARANWEKYEYFFDEAKKNAKYPKYTAIAEGPSSSDIIYFASPEDMPLVEKALEDFDSTAVKATTGDKQTKRRAVLTIDTEDISAMPDFRVGG